MTAPKATEKRGRRGAGTIYWDAKKKCDRGEISLGYTPSGRRKRRKVYGPTIADVQDSFRKLREEEDNGVKTTAAYTVAHAVRDWLARGLVGRDEKTIEKNRILAETHVIPGVGKARLRDLTADDVDDWLDELKRRLSTRSLKDCLAILRRSIDQAQRRNKVMRNVADLVMPPKGKAGRPSKSMTLEQAEAVMEASRKTGYGRTSCSRFLPEYTRKRPEH